ncbi:MAG: hypothetical protein HFH91_02465 [Lachnospiraceae bacterium]|nr:hypothetical protein [Lachnospiraceae bacterium]
MRLGDSGRIWDYNGGYRGGKPDKEKRKRRNREGEPKKENQKRKTKKGKPKKTKKKKQRKMEKIICVKAQIVIQ